MSGSSALCDLVLKQKSSEKIARPPNAFMLFARDNRSVLASKNREVTNKTISMMLGKMWRSLGPDVKVAYYEQAKYLNDLHKRRFPGYDYGNVPGAVSSPQNTCLVGDPNKMDGWKSPSAFHSSTSPFQNNYVSPRLLEPGSRASYTQMVPPYMFLTTANRQPLPRFHPLFLNSTYPKPEYFDVPHSSYDGPRSRFPVTVPQGMHDARRQAYFPQFARTMEASSSTSAVPYMRPSCRPAYVSSDFRKNGYPFQSPHGYQVHDEIPQTRYALPLPHAQPGFYDASGNRSPPSSLPTTAGHDNVPPSKSYSDYTIHSDSTQDKEITPSREEIMTSVEVKTEDEEEAGMRIIENGSLGKTHDQVIDGDVDEEINVDT